MKPELLEHLNKSRDAITELDSILSGKKYGDDLRTALVFGQLTTVIQYHGAIFLLVHSGYVRPAAALARDVVDNMYTALWINGCASPDQIAKIESDDGFPVTYGEIFQQVDSKYRDNGFFQQLSNRCGAPLYRFNRSGILSLGRWALGSDAKLHHDEHEISLGASAVTLCVLFLASEFLVTQNLPAESKSVQAIADHYEKRSGTQSLFLHKSA